MKIFVFEPDESYSGGLLFITAKNKETAQLLANSKHYRSPKYTSTFTELRKKILEKGILDYIYIE